MSNERPPTIECRGSFVIHASVNRSLGGYIPPGSPEPVDPRPPWLIR
jgi:hypothetical protein